MTPKPPAYRGWLRRNPATGEIEGEIREVLTGWPMRLELTRTDTGYDVVGILGPTPEAFRVPGIDEEIGSRG